MAPHWSGHLVKTTRPPRLGPDGEHRGYRPWRHNWHVYNGVGFIAYTAPCAECVAWIARIGGKPVEDK